MGPGRSHLRGALLVALLRAYALLGGYDLATFSQAAWLITQGQAPFVTIRGLHLLGDHAYPVFYPIAWLTWALPTVPTLLAVQAAALAAGIVPCGRWPARWPGSTSPAPPGERRLRRLPRTAQRQLLRLPPRGAGRSRPHRCGVVRPHPPVVALRRLRGPGAGVPGGHLAGRAVPGRAADDRAPSSGRGCHHGGRPGLAGPHHPGPPAPLRGQLRASGVPGALRRHQQDHRHHGRRSAPGGR